MCSPLLPKLHGRHYMTLLCQWTSELYSLLEMKEGKHLEGRGLQPSFFFSHALINRNHVISQHNKYGIKQTLTA